MVTLIQHLTHSSVIAVCFFKYKKTKRIYIVGIKEPSHSHFPSQRWHILLPLAWFLFPCYCLIWNWVKVVIEIRGVNDILHLYYILLLYECTLCLVSSPIFFHFLFEANKIKTCHCPQTLFLSWKWVCVASSSSTIHFLFKIRIEHISLVHSIWMKHYCW